MINPFDLPSLWKAVRTFSLTFAVVFSSALLGVSVTRLLRRALGELSLPWIFLWLVPMFLIGLVAKNEHRIVRNAALRRKIAVVVLLAAVCLNIVLGRLRKRISPPERDPYPRQEIRHNRPEEYGSQQEETTEPGEAPPDTGDQGQSRTLPRGPRSK